MSSKIGVDFVWTNKGLIDQGQQDIFNEDRIKYLLKNDFTEVKRVNVQDPVEPIDVTLQIFTNEPVELTEIDVQQLTEIWQQLSIIDTDEFPGQVDIPLTSGQVLVYHSGL